MKTFLAAAVSTMLAFPAIATTYSGTGAIVGSGLASIYSPGDIVTWSFTTGDPLSTPIGMANELTAFNLNVSGQTWALTDFFPLLSPSPVVVESGGFLELVFAGRNSNDAYILTGIKLYFDPSFPVTSFLLTNPGADASLTIDQFRGLGTLDGPLAPPPAIPEPASWAMLIAGFGLTGAIARRRRQAVAV